MVNGLCGSGSARLVAIVVAAASALLFLSACERRAEQGPRPALRVVTTTAHIADAVRNVAGERLDQAISVRSIMGEGVDPHTFKLTQSDTAMLTNADMIFFNGLHLEGTMAKMVDQLQQSSIAAPASPEAKALVGRRLTLLSDALPPERVLRPEGAMGQPDPHFWMDIELWSAGVERIAADLGQTDGLGLRAYADNAKAYNERLKRLDDYARTVLGSIPPTQRTLVTSHDAFNYLGHRYGLRVLGIQGLSTESEAGVKDIQRLVDVIVADKVPAVFVETSVSDKAMRALIEGVRAKGGTIKEGGALFSDAQGKPGTYEGTYIGMMDHNVTTIARALGGTAPEGGFKAIEEARAKAAKGAQGEASAPSAGSSSPANPATPAPPAAPATPARGTP
jgi:manganese/zinc/iron transport system substrate-binding protein